LPGTNVPRYGNAPHRKSGAVVVTEGEGHLRGLTDRKIKLVGYVDQLGAVSLRIVQHIECLPSQSPALDKGGKEDEEEESE